MKIIPKLFFCLLLFALVSCKKNPVQPEENPTLPSNQHGSTIGTPIQQTIGAAGGTIKTADENIQLVIPAGAVETDVNFSIQEVASTVGESGIGRSFRLLPENVEFKKDVDLTFKVPDSLFVKYGIKLDRLRLVYQNSKGEWRFGAFPKYVDYNRTVTVKTKHFSDWTLMSGVKIILTGKDELTAGKTTTLKAIMTAATDNEDFAVPPSYSDVDEWSPLLDQFGSVSGNKETATLTAPNPVLYPVITKVTAYFRAPPTHSNQPYSRFAVQSPGVLMLPNEYLVWWVDEGNMSFATGSYNSTLDVKLSLDGRLTIVGKENATGSNYIRRLSINTKNNTVGKYAFNQDDNYIGHFSGWGYSSNYKDCDQVPQNTAGTITITKNEGGYIEGTVQGNIRDLDENCDRYGQVSVRAKFRVKKP